MTSEPRRWLDDESGAAAARKLLEAHRAEPPPGAHARVWRRLKVSRRPASRLAVGWAISGVAAAAAAFAVWLLQPQRTSDAVEIVRIEGRVLVARGAAAEVGQRFAAGTSIATEEEGRADLQFGSSISLGMLPSTRLSLTSLEPAPSIAIDSGGLLATVDRAETMPPLAVLAAGWRATAWAARFEITRVSRDRVELAVQHGAVRLEGPGASRWIRAGERFDSGGEITAAAPPIEPAPAPAIEPEPEPDAAPVPVEAPAPSRQRKVRPPPKRVVEATAKPEPPPAVPAPAPRPAPDPVPARASATPPIPAPIAPAIAPPPAPPPTEEELYRRASDERDAVRAIGLFSELSAMNGALSEHAAHQAARLEMRIGRYREAARRWSALIERRPRGALIQEARLNLIECLLRTGQIERARHELDRFGVAHPGSERLPEVHFLRAELARAGGQCDSAIRGYRSALESRHADDATYFLAWCQLALGNHQGGRASLEGYLSKFPNGRHAADARAGLAQEKGGGR